MTRNWELKECDQEFFQKELSTFVPDRIFDAHAHLYKTVHWGRPGETMQGPDVVTFEEYQRHMKWITPRSQTEGLFFGTGFSDDRFKDSNEFVAGEVANQRNSRGEMVVSPRMDPEEMRQEVKRLAFSGIKVYHLFVQDERTWDADIAKFLIEDHVRIANEEGWTITLHMVKQRAMAEKANQERILEYCRKYSDINLILAHAARGFNPYHTIEGIHHLKGLQNVWCDTSAVTEAGGFEAIVETLGHERLLWGSDFPVSHGRGRCIAVGDHFVWLGEETLDWKTVAAYGPIEPILLGLESLRSLKLATQRLKLSASQTEDIFSNNARSMLDINT